ncbi:FCD domain-containing protein [Streptomyces sp. NPDC058297]|uniref:FCD domain-containing protein n=1 Tax=Streptomyces sp. NPDC058297 TaxID=3346433 RepID=UPI0036F0F688
MDSSPTAAEPAALRRTETDISAMRAAVDQLLPVTRQWGEDALSAHRVFHQTLYRASRNDLLIKMLDDPWDKPHRYRRLGLDLPPGDEPRTRDLEESRFPCMPCLGHSAGLVSVGHSTVFRRNPSRSMRSP